MSEQKVVGLNKSQLLTIVKTIIFIGCLAGCLYQCISVLSIYFKYQSNVVVKVNPNDKIRLPGITLCSSIG